MTRLAERWNAFFFAARDPRLASAIRIAYGGLLLINILMWAPDLEYFFGDAGVLSLGRARLLVHEDAPTLLAYLPLWVCYGLLVAHAILLTVGWHTRVQAICVLIWLTQFHDRNAAMIDGEDTVFRLFAFYLALCPAGWAFSLDARKRPPGAPAPIPWALRLFQLQMCVIYLSSAIEKSTVHDWTSGNALYYVARIDDMFGKLPLPAFVFETVWLVKLLTWGVLALEWLLPIALLVPRTRKLAVVVGIVFHLAIESTMNLFLFHWIMILGLISFLEWNDLVWFAAKFRRKPAT